MSLPEGSSAPATIDRFFEQRGFSSDANTGVQTDPAGLRVCFAAPEFFRAVHLVLTRKDPASWNSFLARCGRECGRQIATNLDAELARLGQPTLGALPLESCLVFLERTFAAHGWGVLKIDLADAADHGLVIGRLTHSYFAEILRDVDDLVDILPAALLQGFFEYISGEQLGCVEIACVRRGAPHCTFVITAAERLDSISPLIGRETADTILARLKA